MAALATILMPLNPGLLLECCLSRYLALAAAFGLPLLTRASLRIRPGSCSLLVFRTAAGIECSGRDALALLAGAVMGHLYAACFAFCDACNRRTNVWDLLRRPVRLPVHRIGYATGDAHVKVLSGTRTGLLPCCGSTRRLILAPRRGVLE